MSLIVQESFKLDPFSKNIFVFCNRKQDKIKILEWDRNGFWLHYKRLEKNKFRWPNDTKGSTKVVDERAFRWLLDGLSIKQKDAHPAVKERIII